MSARWSTDRGAIPNRAGVRVEVWLTDDTRLITEVVVVADLHCLRDVAICRVRAWRFA